MVNRNFCKGETPPQKLESIQDDLSQAFKKIEMEYRELLEEFAVEFKVAHIKFVTSAEAEQSASQKPARAGQEANALTKDEMITITEAAKLLGIHAGTVSRWTTDGIIKNNGEAKRKRRLSKISVLLLKDKREREDRLKDAADVLQDMEHKIPDRH